MKNHTKKLTALESVKRLSQKIKASRLPGFEQDDLLYLLKTVHDALQKAARQAKRQP